MKRKWYILFSFVFLFLASGCGSGSGSGPNSAASSGLAAQNAAALGSFGLSPQVQNILIPGVQGLAYVGIQLMPSNVGGGVAQISTNMASYSGKPQATGNINLFANDVSQAESYVSMYEGPNSVDAVELAQFQNIAQWLVSLPY